MAWAVERNVESLTGRPLRRHEAYAETLRRAQTGQPGEGASALAYRLMSAVPDYRIPLVPRDYDGSRRLVRATMRGTMLLGRILEPDSPNLRIHEVEVPRDGANVTRSWQLARDPSERTHLWLGRRKGPGRGEGSSARASTSSSLLDWQGDKTFLL